MSVVPSGRVLWRRSVRLRPVTDFEYELAATRSDHRPEGPSGHKATDQVGRSGEDLTIQDQAGSRHHGLTENFDATSDHYIAGWLPMALFHVVLLRSPTSVRVRLVRDELSLEISVDVQDQVHRLHRRAAIRVAPVVPNLTMALLARRRPNRCLYIFN